jgi:quinol-cytochrome oxidoreductase complex cytochrome b subunit
VKPSRTAAAFFTLAVIVAVAETVFTGLYLPWPELTITFGTAACLLACLAAAEWTALRPRHNRPGRVAP